jgi:ribose transport system substrate-binding protein
MRILRFAVPVAVATCAALVLAACSSSGTGTATAKNGAAGSGDQMVIGWANPQAKQPIFTTFTDALNAAAARANVKVITLDGQANPATQVSDIQTFITKKVDAIIVFPLVPEAEAAILNKAHDAGIKIIGLNAILPSAPGATPDVAAPYDANLDWGYVDGSHTSAQYVAQQLQGKGNVVGIKIPVPVPSLVAMLNAYKTSVTDGNPGIHWLAELPDATDDLAGARSSMADAITRYHGDIQAVLAYTDIAAIGAAQALAAAGIKGTVIVGQQGNQTGVDALKSGQIQGDIDTKPYTAAVWALALTKEVVAGSTFPKFVRLPIKFMTKDDVASYVSWSDGVAQIKNGKTSLDVTFGNN